MIPTIANTWTAEQCGCGESFSVAWYPYDSNYYTIEALPALHLGVTPLSRYGIDVLRLYSPFNNYRVPLAFVTSTSSQFHSQTLWLHSLPLPRIPQILDGQDLCIRSSRGLLHSQTRQRIRGLSYPTPCQEAATDPSTWTYRFAFRTIVLAAREWFDVGLLRCWVDTIIL